MIYPAHDISLLAELYLKAHNQNSLNHEYIRSDTPCRFTFHELSLGPKQAYISYTLPYTTVVLQKGYDFNGQPLYDSFELKQPSTHLESRNALSLTTLLRLFEIKVNEAVRCNEKPSLAIAHLYNRVKTKYYSGAIGLIRFCFFKAFGWFNFENATIGKRLQTLQQRIKAIKSSDER